jgi:hypothetical protein
MSTARPRPRATTSPRSPRHTPANRPTTHQAGQAGDPSRLWRAVGLPAQRAAAPRPLFDPDGGVVFRDLAGLFVGPHESVLAVCVDPRPRPPKRGLAAARERGDRRAPRPHDRRLALLLEAIDLVVDGPGEREDPPTADAAPLLEFLERLDLSIAEDLEIHLVIDRRASCRRPEVREWFRKRPRFHVHFTASHRRWRERALAWLTYAAAVQERTAAPRSALALEAALRRFVLQPPALPRAFGWARSADENLTRLARYLLRRERVS